MSYIAVVDGPTYKEFNSKEEAIEFVKGYESGEVLDDNDNQVWVHYPASKHFRY